jgi:hypothetical protein
MTTLHTARWIFLALLAVFAACAALAAKRKT